MVERYYTTLDNVIYDLDILSDAQRGFVWDMMAFYKEKPLWNRFCHDWLEEGRKRIWRDMDRKEVIKHATWKIYQDLGSRLGIEQGKVRLSRDDEL